jgi:hypothetical protein
MAFALPFEPLVHVAVNAQVHGGLPLGITTRARFQKSSPTVGASGALARVLLAPRAAFVLSELSEYLTVVFFCVITVCFPCADDADDIFHGLGLRYTNVYTFHGGMSGEAGELLLQALSCAKPPSFDRRYLAS